MGVDDGRDVPSQEEEITVLSTIPDHARKPIQQRIEHINQVLKSGKELPVEVANLVLSMPDHVYEVPSNIANRAAAVMAPILGFPEAPDPYSQILRTKDVRAALTLARFAVDPRAAIKEYDSVPWVEEMLPYSARGVSSLRTPRFSAVVEGIVATVVKLKTEPILRRMVEIDDSPTFNHRTGEYANETDQITYETAIALSQIIEDQPVDLMAIPKERWREFQKSALVGLKTTQELHGNSMLRPDLHDTIVDLSRVRGGPLQIRGKHVPLMQLLRPTKPALQITPR